MSSSGVLGESVRDDPIERCNESIDTLCRISAQNRAILVAAGVRSSRQALVAEKVCKHFDASLWSRSFTFAARFLLPFASCRGAGKVNINAPHSRPVASVAQSGFVIAVANAQCSCLARSSLAPHNYIISFPTNAIRFSHFPFQVHDQLAISRCIRAIYCESIRISIEMVTLKQSSRCLMFNSKRRREIRALN